MATQNTEWPAHRVTYSVKQLVQLLFQLIEDQADDVGIRLTQQVFAADGFLQASSEKFIGKEGRAQSPAVGFSIADLLA